MKWLAFCIVTLAVATSLGCSGSGDIPTSPFETSPRDTESGSAHMLWGIWQFTVDPVAETLEYVPLRFADMHLNAMLFLEPPAFVNLTLESLEFNGDIIEADIGLRHPFLGADEFTGFDVCGILITRGSVGGFTDPDLLLPGENDLHLLNPDGYIRWWNPSEFPVNDGTMLTYQDGLLGTSHAAGQYTATLNGYKYYCEDFVNADDPMGVVDPTGRGIFRAGHKNIRHFSIQMGNIELIFNYAVDASWEFPSGLSPWDVPGDFGPGANRPEPWNISITATENTLWNDGVDSGGDVSLLIDVYDWFDGQLNLMTVESPDNFTAVEGVSPSGGGTGYSTYQIDVESATPSEDEIDVLITVECEVSGYGGLVPGKTQAAYFMASFPVDNEAPPIPEEDPEEWACFQYSGANIGKNPNPQGFDPNNYSKKWDTPDSGRSYTGPVVTEDYVYVVANPSNVYTYTSYRLTCFTIADGYVEWQNLINPTGDYARGFTSPCWFDDGEDGRVVVGGDRVWCFDAITGDEEWSYGEPYRFVGNSPKVYNDRVYIAGVEPLVGGMVYCIDAYTGNEIWVSDPGTAGGELVLAVVDGKVYTGSGAGGGIWYCLDADDGSEIWQSFTGSGPSHWVAPLVLDDRLYYCSYYQHFVCMDIVDGSVIWEYNESGGDYDNVWMTALTHWEDPSDGMRVIYFGGAYGAGVHAVKDLGSSPSLLWRVASIYADASPVFCEGSGSIADVLYIGDRASDTLYGYDPATGAEIFSQSVVGDPAGAVGFAYGRMIVATDTRVYCYWTP